MWSWGSNHLRQTTMWAVSHSCLVSLVFLASFPALKTRTTSVLQLVLKKGLAHFWAVHKYTPRHVFLWESDGVLGHHCFSSRRVRGHKHGVVSFQPQHGLLLENIELKRPLQQRNRKKRRRFSLNSSPHAVFREATERGENIKIRQMDFIFCYVEPKPWKLGLGCVCRSHRRVMLYSQEWPISCFLLCSLLALISLLFLSLEETKMTQHPAGRGEGNKASEQLIFSNTRQLTHINFLLF